MRTVKIEFNEQSKGISANTKIEVSGETVDLEQVKKESEELFQWAFSRSQGWSRRK